MLQRKLDDSDTHSKKKKKSPNDYGNCTHTWGAHAPELYSVGANF